MLVEDLPLLEVLEQAQVLLAILVVLPVRDHFQSLHHDSVNHAISQLTWTISLSK